MQLDGRTFTLKPLLEDLAKAWGFESWAAPEDLPDGVTIRFAEQGAVLVRLDEDQLDVRLSIDRLEDARGRGLEHFEIRVAYEPVFEDERLLLRRKGVVRVAGKRLGFRDRLPLRAIFSKVFAKNRDVDLMGRDPLEDPRFAGIQLEIESIRDGWISVCLRSEHAERTAAMR